MNRDISKDEKTTPVKDGNKPAVSEFFYRFMRRRITPNLQYAQEIYESTLTKEVGHGVRWLDLGCGVRLLPHWRSYQETQLLERAELFAGIDMDLPSLIRNESTKNLIQGNILYLPFKNESFDVVSSNMVVEHLEEPLEQLKDIYRILKPGGLFIFHTPNLLGYGLILGQIVPEFLKKSVISVLEERNQEDVFPTYYRLNSAKAIEATVPKAGFQIGNIRFIVTTPHFIKIPFLLIFELIWIRILMTSRLKAVRPNLISILRKPDNIEVK